MARDFRHGHGQHRKQTFQRKSQATPKSVQSGKSSVAKIWAGGFLVSIVLLIGFFVTQHFASQGVKSNQVTEKSIFSTATEIKEKAVESVQGVSAKLQPKPVVVEAVKITPDKPEQASTQEEPKYSFYDGLGQMEVVVDAEPIPVALEQPYYIQAGTFGSEEIAKKEQKRLARLGQKVEISNLKTKVRTYYRLRVGPFTDRLVMNKRRNELRQLGVDTLLIKAPKVENKP
ncbi:SPOR domain-containing protein [Thiomicrorhabdus sp.]|uniref:SPOR domain-containing protein n=1 Tax=Thiomicrorhabdus sp. TaxID=2039724 RepID=UPI002AA7F557|nr:SPOR domain-containing protein [Thiomicrorhabdus sp.]